MLKNTCIKFSLISLLFIGSITIPSEHFSQATTNQIANYILDGSLVLYSPRVSKAIGLWRTVLSKIYRNEFNNTLYRYQFLIRERLSVNIFEQQGAEQIGIDYEGAVAYVHLNPEVSYMIFTIKNENLLRNILDNLAKPVPYRIEGQYIMFTGAWEFLEYYDFKGIDKLSDYMIAQEVLNLNWDKNLIWIDSAYFKNKFVNQDSWITMGDKIIGSFDMNGNDLIIDVFTKYEDPLVNQYLRESDQVQRPQRLNILDYEYGTPAVVGQSNFNLWAFLQMMREIDRAGIFGLTQAYEGLNKFGIDLNKDVFQFLKGQVSYTIRQLDILNRKISMTLSAEVKNKRQMRDNLKDIVRRLIAKGVPITYRDLFTQQFYGWEMFGIKFWVGMAEDNFLLSTDELHLFNYVENIYQRKYGFINRLPLSFQRLRERDVIGGQMIFSNPYFLQDIVIPEDAISYQLLVSLQSLEWDYYFINRANIVGRRDIFVFKFNE